MTPTEAFDGASRRLDRLSVGILDPFGSHLASPKRLEEVSKAFLGAVDGFKHEVHSIITLHDSHVGQRPPGPVTIWPIAGLACLGLGGLVWLAWLGWLDLAGLAWLAWLGRLGLGWLGLAGLAWLASLG